jgi:hypothetical protein
VKRIGAFLYVPLLIATVSTAVAQQSTDDPKGPPDQQSTGEAQRVAPGETAGTQPAKPVKPAKKSILRQFEQKIVSPENAVRTVAGAAINQARDYPSEWGSGGTGFAKRIGSAFGQHIIKEAIEVPVAAALHEDLHYQRSNLKGTWPRLKYAVVGTFIVPKTNSDGKTLAVGRIAGDFGGGLISRAWMPRSVASIGSGFAAGGVSIGVDVGIHVAREFWPKKKKPALAPPATTGEDEPDEK